MDLNLGRDVFVEIANKIPGAEEYNEIVRLYRAQKWDGIEKKIEMFRKAFESSPLQEAVTFLAVQVKFETLRAYDSHETLTAEKNLRQALFLYPKTELGAALSANMANFWLFHGQYARSLALFQSLETQYPDHELRCVFQAGQGESSFKLSNWNASQDAFKKVAEHCANLRLKAGAELRVAEIEWYRGLKSAEDKLKRAIDRNLQIVETRYPWGLFNLGEIKYRAGKLKSARYYFSQYLRSQKETRDCMPYALKRLADIAYREGRGVEEAAGLYLAVRDRAPLSDVGVFSYARALLMTLPQASPMERSRRMKVIDEELQRVGNAHYRLLITVEKNLAGLASGDMSAMEGLDRLEESHGEKAFNAQLRACVTDHWAEQLTAQMTDTKEKGPARIPSVNDLKTIERYYGRWIKGTAQEEKILRLYSQTAIRVVEEAVKKGDLEKALGVIKKWKNSSCFKESGLTDEDAARILVSLLGPLYSDTESSDRRRSIAAQYLSTKPLLSTVFGNKYEFFWVKTSLEALDVEQAKELMKGVNAERGLASVSPTGNKDLGDFYWLSMGEGYRVSGRLTQAEVALKRIPKKSALYAHALGHLFSIYQEKKDYAKAFGCGEKLLALLKPEQKKAQLDLLRQVVLAGALWGRTSQLLKWASDESLSDQEKAPFQYLSGRSYFERKDCDRSINSYYEAIRQDPDPGFAVEAKYRIGKCLIKKKRTVEARRVWQEVVGMKDSFWSPLAKNEIKLLGP